MLIVLCGETCSGKDTIARALIEKCNFNRVVSVTTRPKRHNEIDGVDYHFVDDLMFELLRENDKLCCIEEYSQNRKYAILKKDLISSDENRVIILSPGGVRELLMLNVDKTFIVKVKASLGERMIRYIKRCGDDFDFDDKNELCNRVERDYAAFLSIEKFSDMIVLNDLSDEDSINNVIEEIMKGVESKENEGT